MPEELEDKSNEEVTTVGDHTPTDEELSSAFDSFVTGVEKEEFKEVETIPVEEPVQVEEPVEVEERLEEEDHSEKTRLGRKVQKLYERIENTVTKSDLEKIMERIDNILLHKEAKEEPEEEPDFDLNTKEGVDEYLDYRETKKAEEQHKNQKTYVDGYLKNMKSFINTIEDERVKKIVYAEMIKEDSPYNRRFSNSPEADCAKNFAGALVHVTKMVSKKEDNVFSKEKTSIPSGVSGVTTTNNVTAKSVKLDDIAAEFVRRTGMKEEDVILALDNDMPANLKGKHR